MRLAFYRANCFYQHAIAWWTRPGPYCHVELVFDDTHFPPPAAGVIEHDPYGSLCFSSSEQDGGTRFKLIDLDDGKWDLVDIHYLDNEKAMRWCLNHRKVDYDWRGLRGFVFPWEGDDPKNLFCSECAIACMQDQDSLLELNPGRTSPNALFQKINNGKSDARQ